MNTVNVELFGRDPKVLKAINFAQNVSVTKVPVLIVGEVGTGKRTLGSYIHQSSSRGQQPFLVVDCADEPIAVENAILGHREENSGEFKKGVIEAGNGGTVVFANIDSLEENFQKRLHKIFNELADYEIDIRIIATTTKNLSKLVGSGRFYRGLYTYISGTQINLTPLRERTTDIQYLAQKYLEFSAVEKELPAPELTTESMNKLTSHYWTHNLSELRALLESSIQPDKALIDVADLAIGERKTVSMIADESDDGIKLMSLKEAERVLIKKALVHTSENRTQAAKILGVSIRTLRNKINEYRSDGNSYFVNLR